jgi:hypothetical protein
LTLTLLAVDLVPKPVPPTASAEMLKLCLAGLKEVRTLGTLLGLRSMHVSKALKSELLALEAKLTYSGESMSILNAHHLAFNVLVDLRVSDIHPICAFLGEIEGDYHWAKLVALAATLEKSTHGKLIPGLTPDDIQPFNAILHTGLRDFESNCNSPATLSFLNSLSRSTKSHLEFPSSMH